MPQLTHKFAEHAPLKSPKGGKKSPRQSKYHDGGGLYLIVRASKVPDHPTRWWYFRFRLNGKPRDMSLGSVKEVSLKEARAARDAAKELLDKGIDPVKHRQLTRARNAYDGPDTLENVAREWLAGMSNRWNESTTVQNSTRLEQMVFPWLGSKVIGNITAPDVLETLQRIQSRGTHETAYRVKSLMARVFRYAVAQGVAERNPVADIGNEALFKPKAKHMGAITDPDEIGRLLRVIDAYKGTEVVRSALKFSPLVFQRPGEVRQVEWIEIDLENALWRIPAHKMKMNEAHLVPLSRQAIQILMNLQPLTGRGVYVFPSARSRERPMSADTIRAALIRMDYEPGVMTAHGFRTLASTRLHEMGWDSDVIERQLAHAEGNKVKAAYSQARHLEQRIKMMQEWADYLDVLRKDKSPNCVDQTIERASNQ